MRRQISFADLPHTAQKLISLEQYSYIDEFVFIQDETRIEAFYADELLCVWSSSQWTRTVDAKSIDPFISDVKQDKNRKRAFE